MAVEDHLHRWLKSYMAAPQWAKYVAGSIYRAIPADLRYGRIWRRFAVEEALRTPALVDAIRRDKLAATLRWAVATVPAWNRYVRLLDDEPDPDRALALLPLVDKSAMKRAPEAFVSTGLPPRARLAMFTGGSTAHPMRFFLEKGVTRSKEHAYIAAWNRMAGLDDRGWILNLRGRSVAGRPGNGRIWMVEPIRRHLILSSDHLEARYMPDYIRVLRRYRPRFVQAFPSAIVPLARWLLRHPEPAVTSAVRAIQLSSENVLEFQLDLLRSVFDCPILVQYGHSERVLMATTTGNDSRYVFWPLYGQPELVDAAGEPITQPGVLGELVGTSFDNRAMPFIRYRTGDMAMWSADPHPDLPGRRVCERIEGRLQEFVVCRDHRLVSITTLGAAHFEVLADAEAIQYEQSEPGRLTLNLQLAGALQAEQAAGIARAIARKTQGGCEVEVRRVDRIERTERGKMRMLIQHLDLQRYLGASVSAPASAGAPASRAPCPAHVR